MEIRIKGDAFRQSTIVVKEIEYHRNGVGGAPFYVVLFRDETEEKNMMGVVFDDEYHVAVFDINQLAEGNIRFGENSWRGDSYESPLRQAIAQTREPEPCLEHGYRCVEDCDSCSQYWTLVEAAGAKVGGG